MKLDTLELVDTPFEAVEIEISKEVKLTLHAIKGTRLFADRIVETDTPDSIREQLIENGRYNLHREVDKTTKTLKLRLVIPDDNAIWANKFGRHDFKEHIHLTIQYPEAIVEKLYVNGELQGNGGEL